MTGGALPTQECQVHFCLSLPWACSACLYAACFPSSPPLHQPGGSSADLQRALGNVLWTSAISAVCSCRAVICAHVCKTGFCSAVFWVCVSFCVAYNEVYIPADSNPECCSRHVYAALQLGLKKTATNFLEM